MLSAYYVAFVPVWFVKVRPGWEVTLGHKEGPQSLVVAQNPPDITWNPSSLPDSQGFGDPRFHRNPPDLTWNLSSLPDSRGVLECPNSTDLSSLPDSREVLEIPDSTETSRPYLESFLTPRFQRGFGEPKFHKNPPDLTWNLSSLPDSRGFGDPKFHRSFLTPRFQRGFGNPKFHRSFLTPKFHRGFGEPKFHRNPPDITWNPSSLPDSREVLESTNSTETLQTLPGIFPHSLIPERFWRSQIPQIFPHSQIPERFWRAQIPQKPPDLTWNLSSLPDSRFHRNLQTLPGIPPHSLSNAARIPEVLEILNSTDLSSLPDPREVLESPDSTETLQTFPGIFPHSQIPERFWRAQIPEKSSRSYLESLLTP
nr:uncharacterized protein LOC113460824 [Zonotrichia albicollis]